MKANKLLAAALFTGAAAVATGAYAAGPLTFNPSAPNPGAVNVSGGAAGPIGPQAAFQLDNASLTYAGVLDINRNTGSFSESGNIKLSTFSLQGTQYDAAVTGLNRQLGGTYDIYASFVVSGAGVFANPSTFFTTSVNSFQVKLYASPTLGTPPGPGQSRQRHRCLGRTDHSRQQHFARRL